MDVPALPVTEIGSNDEHVAGVAETEAGLVGKADGEVQRSVIDGVGDEVHDLAVDLGIPPAQPFLSLLAVTLNLPSFFSCDPGHDRFPALLLPAFPGVPFLRLLLDFPALFIGSDRGVREDADPWRQSLLLAFFFAFLDA